MLDRKLGFRGVFTALGAFLCSVAALLAVCQGSQGHMPRLAVA